VILDEDMAQLVVAEATNDAHAQPLTRAGTNSVLGDEMSSVESDDEMAPATLLKASWDSNASCWTEVIRAGGIASRQLVTDRAIVDTVQTLSPRSMLDVGCGEGWLCRALTDQVPRIFGIDGSEELVAQARQLGGGEFAHLSYAEMRGSVVLANERFDVIVANFALLDDDLPGFLEAMRGMVNDGGALVIQTLHPSAVPPPYRSEWRIEDFAAFDGQADWKPMPWYFRTLGDWIGGLQPHWHLRGLIEPLHPETERPASLILVAEPI